MTKEQVVFEANGRCDQENLNAHLKSGVRSYPFGEPRRDMKPRMA